MKNLFAANSCAAVNTSEYIYYHYEIYFLIDVAHQMLSYLSTCAIEIPLCTHLRLMTSPGCHSEKLSGFHICLF